MILRAFTQASCHLARVVKARSKDCTRDKNRCSRGLPTKRSGPRMLLATRPGMSMLPAHCSPRTCRQLQPFERTALRTDSQSHKQLSAIAGGGRGRFRHGQARHGTRTGGYRRRRSVAATGGPHRRRRHLIRKRTLSTAHRVRSRWARRLCRIRRRRFTFQFFCRALLTLRPVALSRCCGHLGNHTWCRLGDYVGGPDKHQRGNANSEFHISLLLVRAIGGRQPACPSNCTPHSDLRTDINRDDTNSYGYLNESCLSLDIPTHDI